MGGLLSHAMAVESGDEFWKLSSDRSFDDIVGPPEVLAELRHYTFFHAPDGGVQDQSGPCH